MSSNSFEGTKTETNRQDRRRGEMKHWSQEWYFKENRLDTSKIY